MINYVLIRSERRTAALYVRDGGVEIRAPLKMPRRDIDEFVNAKEKWIRDKLEQQCTQMARRVSFNLNYGDAITYRGKQYPIEAKDGNHIGFDDRGFYMPPDLSPEQIKAACVRIYRMLAKRDLPMKTLDFAKRMSVMPAAVKINGAKTRWGSCSGGKSINFAWRLIMADEPVVDYVVVHELAHLTEMNHSTRFWAIVEGILPDYRERKARLRELQKRLAGEDWDG